MARSRREPDLKAQALKRYSELMKQKGVIEEELKGLQNYLKAVGAVKGERGRKVEAKRGQAGKPSATGAILAAIGRSEKGISIGQIMKTTGFGRQTVNGVLNRMKKEGKVRNAGRGIYVTA